ncbi:MAG TPA: hypothetical protein VFV50_18510 [Bdellovibrionales bacterium]|nr:hypothetical protein [Bdellovibrionales bacterium]
MKIFGIVFGLLLAVSAHGSSDVVFQCTEGGSRSFTIYRLAVNQYGGTFYDFSGLPQRYDCVRTGRGYSFKCTRGDYIVTVRRSAQGSVVVDFELKGDFYPDSGYLHQMTCANIQRRY